MTFTAHSTCFLITLALAGCGSPARTETTSTTRVEHRQGGGEVRHTSQETVETSEDGSQTTNRTESTQTETPPP